MRSPPSLSTVRGGLFLRPIRESDGNTGLADRLAGIGKLLDEAICMTSTLTFELSPPGAPRVWHTSRGTVVG